MERIDVESAEEMFAATHERIDDIDIFIGAAAVADYSAVNVEAHKIKKSAEEMSIHLVRTPDILASVAALEDGPFTVGFAAETRDLRKYALSKLQQKNLDMIIANQVGDDRGFERDENTVEVLWPDGERSFPTMDKKELAVLLIALIAERFGKHSGDGKRGRLQAV